MNENDQLSGRPLVGLAPAAIRILLVEDEALVAASVSALLEANGLEVTWAATGADAKRQFLAAPPDVALVDIGLPDTSGGALIRWLVEQGSCGIIVLSGLTDEGDRVLSLELGADDYVLKPPAPRELIARIHAVRRRVAASGRGEPGRDTPSESRQVALGDVRVDLVAGEVLDSEGRTIDLTSAEYRLLETLIVANGRAVSRTDLCRDVLHRPWRVEDRSIDQLVFQLRQKLAPEGDGQRLLQTVRGAGYLLRHAAATG